MYDYFFYGASMFPSNGNHLVKAVKKGSMSAVDAVEQLIAGDHLKALGKLMADADSFNADTRGQAFLKVIAARKLECFKTMYNSDPFSRGLTTARHRLLLQLDEAGWKEALEIAVGCASYANVGDVFKFVSRDMPDAIRRDVIAYQYGTSVESLLDYAASYAPAWVSRFLDMMDRPPNANKLGQLAVYLLGGNNDAAETEAAFDLLLSCGMNVNFENGAVMVAALSKGQIGMAQKLVDAGFEPSLSRTAVYERLCAVGAPRAGIDFIKQFMGPIAADNGKTQDGFTRSDEFSVSCVQALPNGGQLTMLFNFATAQQIVIAQMGEQMAAPAIVPFSHIENRHLLEKAAAAFIAGGGDEELASSAATARKSPLAKPQAGA